MNIESITKKMYQPLSGSTLMSLSRCNKLFTYGQISKLTNYRQLFDNNGLCLILFETKKNYGHWVCIIMDTNKNSIYFFDSYGTFPDDELKYIPNNFKSVSKQDYAYLSQLFEQAMDDGYKIDYNEYVLQGADEKISTCGRWCGIRLLLRNLSNDEFYKYIKLLSKNSGFSILDFLITVLTFNF